MPDFELPDATGKIVRSAELRASGPLLIMFYGIVNLRTKPETLVP
jgi:peroxiredoxin